MERTGDSMPYVNKPRPYKREWELQQARDEKKSRAARERARYKLDTTSADKNKNGKADKREGKDIDHIVPLSKGGSNSPKNLRIRSASQNRSYSRNSDHTVKVNKPKKK
jgi:5-methylcytosine-specific restriction endonuclease McrA